MSEEKQLTGSKSIKDYLHLYLGCEVIVESFDENIVCKIINVSVNGGGYATGFSKDGKIFNRHGLFTNVKLILRPLSDITNEELQEAADVWKSISEDRNNCAMQCYAASVKYYLSKHFDLFGLIESGLAIDSPQKIKHHLEALVTMGTLDKSGGEYKYTPINNSST